MNNWYTQDISIININNTISYNFLIKKVSTDNLYSSILEKYILSIITPYNNVISIQIFFYISYFFFFEFWNKQVIYTFFFSKPYTYFFTNFLNNNVTNISSQKYIFNSFMAKSLFSKINLKVFFYINKLEILNFLSKFSKKYNFCIITLNKLYNRIFQLNFYLDRTLNISATNWFFILKTIFVEYRKNNRYWQLSAILNKSQSQFTIIDNYDFSIFLNSYKSYSKYKFFIDFSFILNFLRVQRRYNKRRYSKSRLYSRPSFFGGICLSSVIISSFWGGTIKSVDWLTVLPIAVNVNYILYILFFFFLYKFILFCSNTTYLHNSNKFKIYYFLKILFFRKLFKNIIK